METPLLSSHVSLQDHPTPSLGRRHFGMSNLELNSWSVTFLNSVHAQKRRLSMVERFETAFELQRPSDLFEYHRVVSALLQVYSELNTGVLEYGPKYLCKYNGT